MGVTIKNLRMLAASLSLAVLFPGEGLGETMAVGPGSISMVRPEKCKPLPEKIYRAASLEGATPTNQWWSSLVWERYSQTLFAHPLAAKAQSTGLTVGYPGAAMVADASAIIGGGLGELGDFTIGLAGEKKFEQAVLEDCSDWFIGIAHEAGEASLVTRLGHGSPFIYCRTRGGTPCLRFSEVPVVWSPEEKSGAVLGITVRGNHYGLFGAGGSSWQGVGTQTFVNETARDYFSVALLPDNKPATLARFARCAHRHVIGTRMQPKVGKGWVTTRYEFELEALEGLGDGTIFALYPHQWKYLAGESSAEGYASVRGEMKLAEGSGFTTRVPIHGMLPQLPAEGIRDKERLRAYLREEPAKEPADYADTYWEGKHLGKLATLAGVAEALGEPDLVDDYLDEIRTRLENWFTASDGEQAPLFYYNRTWGTLVGSVPSYGSDDQINDHHFHYGYFIRAAAEVARRDPEWAAKWTPMVEMLIRDIASPRRDDPMFPYVRCFDFYAGHSWASGHAKFGDGNNQESSSESLNAWYGIALWGAVMGNDTLRDLGIFLFNTERTAVEEYWFDVAETNFPEGFTNEALGMVWGGKGAFATWFSGKIDHIHGINWLPFTPASLYMGRHPDYVQRNYERIVEVRKEGDDFNSGWGDLIVMFKALHDPESAVAYLETTPDCSLEGGNTHAFMDHWTGTLATFGQVDRSVQSNHPFATVHVKDGKKSYLAFAFGKKPVQVTFSDGTTMTAKPGVVGVQR